VAIVDILLQAQLIFDRMANWLNAIVIALVIVLVGFILGRIIDRVLYKFFLRINFDDMLYKLFGARRRYSQATRRTIVRLIYLLSILAALARLNLDKMVITLVIGLIVLVIVVSLFMAGTEILPNLLARWRLQQRKIVVGDTVEFVDASGIVKGKIVDITLLEVQIRRAGGDLVFVPLAAAIKNKITRKRS